MKSTTTTSAPKNVSRRNTGADKTRRRYDSPLRRQQSNTTLELILATGMDLMHGVLEWDITRLNARIIAERANISMRTVQRYFVDERSLRDAVMQRSVEKSGIALDKLKLDNFSKTTARMFRYLASLPVAPSATAQLSTAIKDPTYVVMDQDRRDAVLNAVTAATAGWSDDERLLVAGLLDVLWSIPSYERLVVSWGLDADNATRALTWLIDLVTESIRNGHKPE